MLTIPMLDTKPQVHMSGEGDSVSAHCTTLWSDENWYFSLNKAVRFSPEILHFPELLEEDKS